jgi:hypothetical protein
MTNRNQKINFIISEKYKDPFIVNIKSKLADPEIEQAANDDLSKLRQEGDEVIERAYKDALIKANIEVFEKSLCTSKDFELWSEREYWTTREAALLSLKLNPNKITDSMLSDYNAHLPFVKEYREIKESLDRAQETKWKSSEFSISAKTSPMSFIEWSKNKENCFPKELEKLVKKHFKPQINTQKENFSPKNKKKSSNNGQTQRQNNNLLTLLFYIAENKFSYTEGNEKQVAKELYEISGGFVTKQTIEEYLRQGLFESQSREKKELAKNASNYF